jgi:hypothetical protein
MTLTDQLLDGDAFSLHAILLDKRKHFLDCFTLCTIGNGSALRLLLVAQSLQGSADYLFDRAKVAGFQLVLDYFLLPRRQIDLHRLSLLVRTQINNTSVRCVSSAFSAYLMTSPAADADNASGWRDT